jgi:tetraacyldisaccharide 4'-kinase
VRQALLEAWTHRGWLAWLLWPASLVYGTLVAARRGLYQFQLLQTHRLAVPVIVVGNVVAGGGGKTPTVIALVQHLRQRGLHPGVISRGYGRSTADCREVLINSTAHEVGDEPLLVARACAVPVFVALRRVDAARALLLAWPTTSVIVCDDGLQHYALKRDIEICVFDESGAGNGFLLPAGPLREAWPRAVDVVGTLEAVDIVLHTGSTPAFAGYTAKRALASYAQRADGSRIDLAELAQHPVTAIAGIAHPERFFSMLEARGLTLSQRCALPDHYDFADWNPPSGSPAFLVCTAKDAVKLWKTHPQAWAVPLEFTPEPAMFTHLDDLLNAKLSSINAPT